MALAVLARSMKEGQYYMTPLYLVSLPLILVTLTPEVALNLFYSLVPITGRLAPAQGPDPGRVRRWPGSYFLPVLLPTLVYGWLALRWAVDLFNREDVVFREAEVFDLRLWLRHLVRDKEPTPGAGLGDPLLRPDAQPGLVRRCRRSATGLAAAGDGARAPGLHPRPAGRPDAPAHAPTRPGRSGSGCPGPATSPWPPAWPWRSTRSSAS